MLHTKCKSPLYLPAKTHADFEATSNTTRATKESEIIRQNLLSDAVDEDTIVRLEKFASHQRFYSAVSIPSREIKNVLGVWQTYISQADTSAERFFRLERLTKAYSERVHFFANHRFFAKSWLKYVSNPL